MRALLSIASVSCLLLTSGCGDVTPPSRPPLAPPGIAIPTAEKPAAPPSTPAPAQAAKPTPPPTAPAAAVQRTAAEVGVGKKGHYGGQGPLVTPLEVYFRAAEMTVFKIQIPEAMKLYKAVNDNRGPATNDEFMQKIIKDNQIRLPQLPFGHRYVYDPKTEQLMVEKPAQ